MSNLVFDLPTQEKKSVNRSRNLGSISPLEHGAPYHCKRNMASFSNLSLFVTGRVATIWREP